MSPAFVDISGYYMKFTGHIQTFSIVAFMLVLTSGFIFSLANASEVHAAASTGEGREPVPGPVPVPPACPTAFDDVSCSAAGQGTGTVVAEASGIALNACQPQYNRCERSQFKEYKKNQEKCEEVPGCALTAETIDKKCQLDQATDCEPNAGLSIPPAGTTYTCSAGGKLDITNYKCERPAPTPTPEQTPERTSAGIIINPFPWM